MEAAHSSKMLAPNCWI